MLDFGKKENDGFIDGAARRIKDAAINIVIIGLIIWLWRDFTGSIREGNYIKTFKYLLVVAIISVWVIIDHEHKRNTAITPFEVDYSSGY